VQLQTNPFIPFENSIAEFMNFFSRTVAERTSSGQRQSIQENSYTAHVFSRASDNLSGVIVTDAEYPVRVAFSLLNKILDEFTTNFTRSVWEGKAEEGKRTGKPCLIEWSKLSEYIVKYQDPRQADTIMKVQQELDETKIILVGFIVLLILLSYHAVSRYIR
jgi:synaptobrevin family protein YKT6